MPGKLSSPPFVVGPLVCFLDNGMQEMWRAFENIIKTPNQTFCRLKEIIGPVGKAHVARNCGQVQEMKGIQTGKEEVKL